MNNEFFEALEILEKEKGLTAGTLIEKIETAIALAVKKDSGGCENVNVTIDPEKQKFNVSLVKTVVDEVEDTANQIHIDDAKKHSKKALVGDTVEISLNTKQFGRIAAQAAKHVIKQGIREAERGQMYEQFKSKMYDIVTGTVMREELDGSVVLDIDGKEVDLFKNEQMPGDRFRPGGLVKVYVSDISGDDRRSVMKITRMHKNFVKRLFELEIPEIIEGIIEIRAISRESGIRSKIAVFSSDEDVDPVGACIGSKGSRLQNIIDELGGEKIDVVEYSDDDSLFIERALAPAKVVEVNIHDMENRVTSVRVPDHQLSLAIGNKGINVKLAAKLTRFKIDIHPESGYFSQPEEPS
ncbi:MAG: transcription termination factor NusA [Oscillospiraceae bacterium]|nr:transcription termination factor NusA [Oscillospiraceae bacterium]